MSKAYKCDICGEFYTAEAKSICCDAFSLEVDIYTDNKRLDICCNCLEAFNDVIKERRKENEK